MPSVYLLVLPIWFWPRPPSDRSVERLVRHFAVPPPGHVRRGLATLRGALEAGGLTNGEGAQGLAVRERMPGGTM